MAKARRGIVRGPRGGLKCGWCGARLKPGREHRAGRHFAFVSLPEKMSYDVRPLQVGVQYAT